MMLTHFGPHSQGKSHIKFLRHHLYADIPKSSNSQLTPLYLHMWENMDMELPIEVNVLYHFAFLQRAVYFLARWRTKSAFPTKLTFSKGM